MQVLTENKVVPKLRFKEFEDEWEEKKLGSCCSSISSGKSSSKDAGEYPVFGSTGVIASTNNYTHEGENILVARVGANAGLINRVDGKYGVTDNTLAVILKDDINVRFCESFLIRFNLNRMIFGSGQPLITGGVLKGIKIQYPSLPEQKKIADFLSSLDNKLQHLKKKKELLEQYKKGLMQKIFSQEIRFIDDNGNDYSNWEEKKLGELFNYKNGGSFENEIVENGAYNLVTLNSIDIKGNLKPSHKQVNITDNSLKKGDIIMVLSDVAHGNFLGLTAIIPNDEFVLNQRMGALKRKNNDNLKFLNQYINYNQKYFKLHGQGSSQQNLSKGDILKFKMCLPTLSEQKKIADFLSSVDKKIDLLDTQITQTESFKKGLLQQMFVAA